jgi:hypothetical protein
MDGVMSHKEELKELENIMDMQMPSILDKGGDVLDHTKM